MTGTGIDRPALAFRARRDDLPYPGFWGGWTGNHPEGAGVGTPEGHGCSIEEVSRFVHGHYLRGVLAPKMRVLEVGAGPGEFTPMIARAGCRVVVVDGSKVELRFHRERSSSSAIDEAVESRVLLGPGGLPRHFREAFDVVVSFQDSPAGDPARSPPAWTSLAAACRPGGHLLLSVLSLWGGLESYLQGRSRGTEPSMSDRRAAVGGPPGTWTEAQARCRMFRAEDLVRMVRGLDMEVSVISASNALSVGWGDIPGIAASHPEEWDRLMEMELDACRDESCLEMGPRILVMGRKRPTVDSE